MSLRLAKLYLRQEQGFASLSRALGSWSAARRRRLSRRGSLFQVTPMDSDIPGAHRHFGATLRECLLCGD